LLDYEIGGKLAPNVYQQINVSIKDKIDNPITIKTPQGNILLTPEEIGMELDLPGTIKSIRKNPLVFFRSSVISTEIKPIIRINDDSLINALNPVSKQNTKAPIIATLDFQNGKVITTEAESGTKIDWEETKKSLSRSWLNETRTAEVVISYIPPAVSNEDVNKVRTNLADLAVAAPITLKIGSRNINIAPEVIGTALNFVANDGKL
ncbi:MAG: peptidoglycan binding domain-containing protein, partial [Actinomycetota bacterium]|nr:peptidoglycan binding domain-containing protein [Actinomycetota bacterium]